MTRGRFRVHDTGSPGLGHHEAARRRRWQTGPVPFRPQAEGRRDRRITRKRQRQNRRDGRR